ncbi:MAG: hypothetical protein ICV53_17645 [Flavisolibacter sp.]|nr:hypothetical protein [Flavisolibacter sp.]
MIYPLSGSFWSLNHPKAALVTVLLLAISFLQASDSLPQKLIIYKMQLENTSNHLITGRLKNFGEDELIYTGREPVFGTRVQPSDKMIPPSQIGVVTLKRKGAIERMALRVGLGGVVAGALWGLIEGSDPPEAFLAWTAGQKAAIYGTMVGVTGAVVGVIIGSVVRKKFIIHGNKEKFQQMKGTLLQKVYGSPSPKQ